MEKRLILAIVLSFLILFLFQLIFVKPQPQPAAPVPAESEAETAAVGNEAAGGEIKEVEKPASMQLKTEGGEIITSEQEQEITIDTPLYTAVWSNKGGVLKSWKLKNHLKKIPNRKNPEREPLDLVPETASTTGLYPFSLLLNEESLTALANNSLYRVNTERLELSSDQRGQLIFEYSDGDRVKVKKYLTFEGQNYNFKTDLTVEIDGRPVEPYILWGAGALARCLLKN